MQIAERYRRGIVTPLTEEAAALLANWEAAEPAQVQFLPIEADALFFEVWQTGLFEDLNAVCGVVIDEYEEECIPPTALSDAISVVQAKLDGPESAEVLQFLRELAELFRSALTHERSVYVLL